MNRWFNFSKVNFSLTIVIALFSYRVEEMSKEGFKELKNIVAATFPMSVVEMRCTGRDLRMYLQAEAQVVPRMSGVRF